MVRVELDIDIPDSCFNCIFSDDNSICMACGEDVSKEIAEYAFASEGYIEEKVKPSWCPLEEVSDEC